MSDFKINIKTSNFDLTPEVRDRVEQKILNLKKFINLVKDQEVIADVEVGKKFGGHHKHGNVFRAEINLQYQGKVYRTESSQDDIFVAVDEAYQEMSRRIKESKEKRTNLIRRGGAKIKNFLKFGRE